MRHRHLRMMRRGGRAAARMYYEYMRGGSAPAKTCLEGPDPCARSLSIRAAKSQMATQPHGKAPCARGK